MKVALCISGHMRSYKKTFQNQLKNIIGPNDCDVYIYTSNLMSQRGNITPEMDPIGPVVNKYNNSGTHSGIMYNVDPLMLESEIENVYGDCLSKAIIEEETLKENVELGYKQSDKYFSGPNRKPWSWVKKTFEKTYKCNNMLQTFGIQQ